MVQKSPILQSVWEITFGKITQEQAFSGLSGIQFLGDPCSLIQVSQTYQTTSPWGYQDNLLNSNDGHPLLEGNTNITTMTLH